jgi:catechol 2,3-dioxygenase-like lactoylglutathione lyase family enzyme
MIQLAGTLSNRARGGYLQGPAHSGHSRETFPGYLVIVLTGKQALAMKSIQCLVETAVYSDDLQQAERFYRDILGLRLLAKEEDRHVFFQVGESDVLLVFRAQATLEVGRLPAHGCRGPGHFAMGIAADDLDAQRDWLLAHGVAIEHEQSWPLGGHSLYFRDPAGNSVELITPGVWGLPAGW